MSAYQNAIIEDQKKRQAEAEKIAKEHQDKLAKIKKDVFGMNPAERQAAYQADLALLKEVYNLELLAAADNAKEKLRIEKSFQKAKLALMEEYNIEGADRNKNFLAEWNDDIMDFLESDLGKAINGAVDTLVSGMSSIFQQLTTIVQAELEIQQASIDKRYDAEVSLAEGNNYKINKLEKQRQAEQAKVKNEANKKMFAMQVIQAVAQTATAALNAYSSAASIPVVGWVMAPIAAAMAVAAGALQIAARNSTTAISSPARVIVENTTSSDDLVQKTEVAEVLRSLNKRLSEPFITVNTVTGDTGIKKAQDEYAKLIANKSPKRR